MTARSSKPRVLHLLTALLLLMLQAAAPLLHAHAADDPLAATSTGVHLPGLEPLATATGPDDVASQRTYPLIEEAECCRESGHPDAMAAVSIRPLFPEIDVAAHRMARSVMVPGAKPTCAPPPPRAPPPASRA